MKTVEYEFSILNCREMFTDLSLVEQGRLQEDSYRMQTQVFENYLNCTMITKINELFPTFRDKFLFKVYCHKQESH